MSVCSVMISSKSIWHWKSDVWLNIGIVVNEFVDGVAVWVLDVFSLVETLDANVWLVIVLWCFVRSPQRNWVDIGFDDLVDIWANFVVSYVFAFVVDWEEFL